jgi:hypothetical protein
LLLSAVLFVGLERRRMRSLFENLSASEATAEEIQEAGEDFATNTCRGGHGALLEIAWETEQKLKEFSEESAAVAEKWRLRAEAKRAAAAKEPVG